MDSTDNVLKAKEADEVLLEDIGDTVEETWKSISDFFTTKYWNIILFVIILVGGFFLIKFIVSLLKKALEARKTESITTKFSVAVVRFVLFLVLLLILLDIIGVNITGIVTAISAGVLAIGMALKDNISNFASGLILVGTGLYHQGDYIKVDGKEGKVDEITFLFTIIYTYNKQKIIIPNSKITSESVVNVFTNKLRRVDYSFSVAYESDVELVKKTIISAMLSDGKVREEPAPYCAMEKMNESSIDFFSTCWCDAEDYWDVFYGVTERVFNEFKRNGISVPFKQMEVRLRTDDVHMPVIGDAIPRRIEKEREEISKPRRRRIPPNTSGNKQ